MGTSLVVQWLRLCASTTKRAGLNPAWGTRSLMLCSVVKKNMFFSHSVGCIFYFLDSVLWYTKFLILMKFNLLYFLLCLMLLLSLSNSSQWLTQHYSKKKNECQFLWGTRKVTWSITEYSMVVKGKVLIIKNLANKIILV